MKVMGTHSSLGRMVWSGLQLSNGYIMKNMLSILQVGFCSAIWPFPQTKMIMVMILICIQESWRKFWKFMSKGLVIVNFLLETSSPLPTLFTFQTPTTLHHLKISFTCMTRGKMLGGGGMLFLPGTLGSKC
jgi:hypothetical protein